MAQEVIRPRLISFLLPWLGLSLFAFFYAVFFLFVAALGNITAFIGALLLILIGSSPLLWGKLRWDNYAVILENNSITIKSGVISKSVASFSYKEIEQVDFNQNFVESIFDIANVNIYTMSAASAVAGTIRGLRKADALYLQSTLGAKRSKAKLQASGKLVRNIQAKETVLTSAKLNLSIYDKMVWTIFGGFALFLWIFTIALLIAAPFIPGEQWPFLVIPGSLAFVFSFITLLIIQQAHTLKFEIQKHQAVLSYEILFNKSQAAMPFNSIQDVTVQQAIFEKWFGLCTLAVQTGKKQYGKNQVFTMIPALSLEEAQRLKKAILEKI